MGFKVISNQIIFKTVLGSQLTISTIVKSFDQQNHNTCNSIILGSVCNPCLPLSSDHKPGLNIPWLSFQDLYVAEVGRNTDMHNMHPEC